MNDALLFKITLAILFVPVALAAGCEERYRYPCQNPANWETAQCQKPLCEVHRQCPDLIFKEEAATVGIKQSQISNKSCDKGCK